MGVHYKSLTTSSTQREASNEVAENIQEYASEVKAVKETSESGDTAYMEREDAPRHPSAPGVVTLQMKEEIASQIATGAISKNEIAENYAISRDTFDRVSAYARYKDAGRLLKTIGIQAADVASTSYDLIRKKLEAQGDGARLETLGAIATYASSRAQAILQSTGTAETEPEWDDVGEVDV